MKGLAGRKKQTDKLIFPVILMVGIPAVIYVYLLEPAMRGYFSGLDEKASHESTLAEKKKQFSNEDKAVEKQSSEKGVIFLLNYLETLTADSNMKMKSFQVIGGTSTKGMPSFQMRFACNADTLIRFMYMSENTKPPLSVSNWRVNSIAGGSFSGMRQLEGIATLTMLGSGGGIKPGFAKLDRYKALRRDPFAELVKEAPKEEPKPEPKEEQEPPSVVKWSLTAQMSDGEGDYMIFTNGDTKQRVITNLKDLEGAKVAVGEEKVEISIGEEKLEWQLGESKEEDKLPAKLKEFILKMKEVPAAEGSGEDGGKKTEKKEESPAVQSAPAENEQPAGGGGEGKGRRGRRPRGNNAGSEN
jgi:hypothetical protein